MKNFVFYLLISVFLLSTSCNKNNISQPEPKPINLNEKEKALIKADNNFGLKLFKETVALSNTQKNIMISPLNIYLALSMTYNGAQGNTKTAFDSVLNFNGMSVDDINNSLFKITNELLYVDDKIEISIANSIWYKNKFEVEPDFISRNSKYYNAEVGPLDFSSGNAINIINKWVNDNTKGRITEIINSVNPNDLMILANAIYFKGEWSEKFNINNTRKDNFYLYNEEIVTVDMMNNIADYDYYENNYLRMLNMTYGRGNYSMVLLLPKDNYNVYDIIQEVNADTWQEWNDGLVEYEDLPLALPKFKFKYNISLNEILSAMGLEIAFTEMADFSGINKEGKISISSVIHKTFIEVNEKGTEAAAVTVVTLDATSIAPVTPFIVDKPFIFAIEERYTNAILFIGIINNPLLN
jgi:serpin B